MITAEVYYPKDMKVLEDRITKVISEILINRLSPEELDYLCEELKGEDKQIVL